MPALSINAARLWSDHMRMAEIGPSPEGGSNRPALSALDAEARALLTAWCTQLGLTEERDALANTFYRDSPDELPSWPPRSQVKVQGGRVATATRREDCWSLADWPTLAVSAEIWARSPSSGRASPAASQIARVRRYSFNIGRAATVGAP